MCAVRRGRGGSAIAHTNEHVVAHCVIGAQFAFSSICICVWEREKRGRAITRPSSLFPWMASAGGNCPSLSSYLAEVFFTPPHVKFINISLSFFFFFCPSECLQIRFSCQTGSCWSLNDRCRCMMRQKREKAFVKMKQKKDGRVISWIRTNRVELCGVKEDL